MRFVLLGIVCLTGFQAMAQLEVGCSLEQKQFLLYEEIPLTVTIENSTSRRLQFSPDDAASKLTVSVEQLAGHSGVRNPFASIPCNVAPYATTSIVVNVAGANQMQGRGQYGVRVRADWAQSSFQSPQIAFEIEKGHELTEKVVEDKFTGDFIRVRMIKVYRNGREYLFARLDNISRNICYGVYNLGRLLSYNDPVLKMDRDGQVHILHRSGPSQHIHTVLMPSGRVVNQEVLLSAGSRPVLEADDAGSVQVTGGQVMPTESEEVF